MVSESPFLTLREAALFLRYSTSSLYKRVDIPRYRMPGSKDWRYDKAELLAWVRSGSSSLENRMAPKSEPAESSSANTSALRQVPRRRSSRYR